MIGPWEQACVVLVFVGLIALLWACFALAGREKPRPGEGDELHELQVTAERVKRLVKADLLDERAGSAVLRAVARRRWHLLRFDPVPRREPPPEEFDEIPVALPVEDDLPVLEPVKVVAKPPRRAKPVLPPPPAPTPPVPAEPFPPPAPPRRWTDVLTGFMEEKNILWGELVGGLLVVGCSVALVISLWRTLSVIPYFPFAVFSAISLALFGVGQYTLHHWKLETTSRALLVITALLLPLNLLVLAGLA